MSYRNNPIRSWKRRSIVTLVTGVLLVIPVTIWSLQPIIKTPNDIQIINALDKLTSKSEHSEQNNPQNNPASPLRVIINQDAFRTVNLWNPQPPPPLPIAAIDTANTDNSNQQASNRPPIYELIGIIEETDGSYKAALYDKNEDRLYIVAYGDHVQKYAITAIDKTTVSLQNGSQIIKLVMQPATMGNEKEGQG